MRKILTALIVVLVLILTIFIQINLLNVVPLFGVTANLGIVVIVGFGLMNGKLIGGLTGAFYGLLLDIIFSKIIGINLILYMLVGIFTGHISSRFSKDNKTAMVMNVLVATVIFEIASYLAISLLQGSEIHFWYMIYIIALETAYNILLTAILHKFMTGIGDIVNKSKNSYYLL
ncbi:MAG: rod shape-determining protein MreD [Clostridia bacterium]|nr:rod shape-determining protein MreD [Clostridia bacterium]